jgi:hypothetical protein
LFERNRRVFTILALACLLAASVAITACGGGGSSADAQQVINDTFSGKKNIDSGKLNLALTAKIDATGVAATQLKDPVTIKLSGPFQQIPNKPDALPKFDFDLTASAAGQSFSAGAISTGDAGYLSYQGTDYKIDSKTFKQFKASFEKSQAQDQGQKQPGFGALGIDPKKWITNVESDGTEDVGGAETNHVSADINVTAFLDDVGNVLKSSDKLNLTPQQESQLPKQIPANVKKQISEAIEEANIQIWSGVDDDILRKLQVTLKFKIPDNLKSQTSGLEGGTIELTAEIADVNKPQTITAPANAKSLSELQSLLNSSPLGALGGTGGTTPPPTGGTTTTPPATGGNTGDTGGSSPSAGDTANAQKYLQCVDKANGDAQATQKCAAVLQGK